MDDETRQALDLIVARVDQLAAQIAPPMSAEDQATVIEAEAEAAVAVIEAQADAEVTVSEAHTEQAVEVLETEAGAEPPTVESALRPEADHWYFKSLGGRR
jgi:alpha/beta superfamily hydrolase